MRDEEPEPTSLYYPPRAPFFSPLRNGWQSFRRQLFAKRSFLPKNLSLGKLLLGFWIPGYGYCINGTAAPARWVLGAWFLGLFTFLALLTEPPIRSAAFEIAPAYLAFGLMISLHATSATHMVAMVWQMVEFSRRVLVGVLVTAFMILFVYFPAWELVQRRWFLPVDFNGTRLIVYPRADVATIRRGETVLYRIRGSYDSGVAVGEGYGLQPVLGLPDDQIRFDKKVFWVNGERQPSRPEMPTEGEVVVTARHWFIWTELHTTIYGNADRNENVLAQRQQAFLKLSLVAQEKFVGRPYERWLFWKQSLP